MPRKSDKRERLVRAAQKLFHRNGYHRTSIADVAREANIPPGNVFYYFKTKEELAEAVIALQNAFGEQLLERLNTYEAPGERILKFIAYFEREADNRAAHGCPVGSFCQEANKLGGDLAGRASAMLDTMLAWLQKQFSGIGQKKAEARASAVHVISAMQGAMLLSHSFADAGLLRSETKRLSNWVRSLG